MGQALGQPVGTIADIKGTATFERADGTSGQLTKGAPVYADDVIETDAQGAVNITFNDNTVFAVSNNAKMTIDEFIYDADKDGQGDAEISVLRGVFVYTSGFVGKEDPSDVEIKTPVGSIGIRGTTLTGYIPPEGSGEEARISLIEGAIVVRPTTGGELMLDQSRETVQFSNGGTVAQNIGVADAGEMLNTFNVVRSVAPQLFAPVSSGVDAPQAGPDGAQAAPVPDSIPQEPSDVEASPESDATQPAADQPPPTEAPAPPPEGQRLNLLEDGILEKPILRFAAQDPMGTNPPPAPMFPPPPPGAVFGPQLPPQFGQGNTLPYQPINFAPIATISTFTALEQAGLEGGLQTLDSSRFFRDPNGDPLTYIIKGVVAPVGVLHSIGFGPNGDLGFGVSNTITADTVVTIRVAATDGHLESSTVDFTFNIYNAVIPGGFVATVGNDTHSIVGQSNLRFGTLAGADTISSSQGGNIVFLDAGNDTGTISGAAGSNNIFFGEGGDDTLVIGSTAGANNRISGGAGNDTLQLDGGTNSQVFGGDGNDFIKIMNSGIVTQIESNTLLVDAGSGFDRMGFATGTNIDFSLVNNDKIHSVEKLLFSGNASVTLDISDIFQISDANFLFIDTSGINDTLTVTNTASVLPLTLINSSATNPYDANDAQIYQQYTNGNATLYVSTDFTTVSLV